MESLKRDAEGIFRGLGLNNKSYTSSSKPNLNKVYLNKVYLKRLPPRFFKNPSVAKGISFDNNYENKLKHSYSKSGFEDCSFEEECVNSIMEYIISMEKDDFKDKETHQISFNTNRSTDRPQEEFNDDRRISPNNDSIVRSSETISEENTSERGIVSISNNDTTNPHDTDTFRYKLSNSKSGDKLREFSKNDIVGYVDDFINERDKNVVHNNINITPNNKLTNNKKILNKSHGSFTLSKHDTVRNDVESIPNYQSTPCFKTFDSFTSSHKHASSTITNQSMRPILRETSLGTRYWTILQPCNYSYLESIGYYDTLPSVPGPVCLNQPTYNQHFHHIRNRLVELLTTSLRGDDLGVYGGANDGEVGKEVCESCRKGSIKSLPNNSVEQRELIVTPSFLDNNGLANSDEFAFKTFIISTSTASTTTKFTDDDNNNNKYKNLNLLSSFIDVDAKRRRYSESNIHFNNKNHKNTNNNINDIINNKTKVNINDIINNKTKVNNTNDKVYSGINGVDLSNKEEGNSNRSKTLREKLLLLDSSLFSNTNSHIKLQQNAVNYNDVFEDNSPKKYNRTFYDNNNLYKSIRNNKFKDCSPIKRHLSPNIPSFFPTLPSVLGVGRSDSSMSFDESTESSISRDVELDRYYASKSFLKVSTNDMDECSSCYSDRTTTNEVGGQLNATSLDEADVGVYNNNNSVTESYLEEAQKKPSNLTEVQANNKVRVRKRNTNKHLIRQRSSQSDSSGYADGEYLDALTAQAPPQQTATQQSQMQKGFSIEEFIPEASLNDEMSQTNSTTTSETQHRQASINEKVCPACNTTNDDKTTLTLETGTQTTQAKYDDHKVDDLKITQLDLNEGDHDDKENSGRLVVHESDNGSDNGSGVSGGEGKGRNPINDSIFRSTFYIAEVNKPSTIGQEVNLIIAMNQDEKSKETYNKCGINLNKGFKTHLDLDFKDLSYQLNSSNIGSSDNDDDGNDDDDGLRKNTCICRTELNISVKDSRYELENNDDNDNNMSIGDNDEYGGMLKFSMEDFAYTNQKTSTFKEALPHIKDAFITVSLPSNIEQIEKMKFRISNNNNNHVKKMKNIKPHFLTYNEDNDVKNYNADDFKISGNLSDQVSINETHDRGEHRARKVLTRQEYTTSED